MKRIIFICSLILLNVNIMAQYYKGDNYQVTFEDNFEDRRYWDRATFIESKNKWQAYLYGTNLTAGSTNRNVYQPSQCLFDTEDGMVKLVADYISPQITCDDVVEPIIPENVECKDSILNEYEIKYFSGALVSVNYENYYHKYKYGYFEIRCKLPVHQGAFPAFWLWDCKNAEDDAVKFYEEIDIFEYSWGIAEDTPNSNGPDDNRCFTTGIYYNETGSTDISTCRVAKVFTRVPDSSPSMDEWNTFGCLWLPDRVEWYINDIKVNSYYNPDSIPKHPMHIKANYAINDDIDNIPFSEYTLSDTMFIDFIRVYQPICDCETNVLIDSQGDLNNYEAGVKRSVTINSSSSTPIIVSSQNDVSIIASKQIVIDKPFKVNAEAKFEAVIQQCPN